VGESSSVESSESVVDRTTAEAMKAIFVGDSRIVIVTATEEAVAAAIKIVVVTEEISQSAQDPNQEDGLGAEVALRAEGDLQVEDVIKANFRESILVIEMVVNVQAVQQDQLIQFMIIIVEHPVDTTEEIAVAADQEIVQLTTDLSEKILATRGFAIIVEKTMAVAVCF